MNRRELEALMEDSGMSAQAFARYVLGRDERTVRRWLTGEVEIPGTLSDWLDRVVEVRAIGKRTVRILVERADTPLQPGPVGRPPARRTR